MASGPNVGAAGVIVPCPQCGTEVLQKAMIPVGVVDGVIQYLCVRCARMRLRTASAAG